MEFTRPQKKRVRPYLHHLGPPGHHFLQLRLFMMPVNRQGYHHHLGPPDYHIPQLRLLMMPVIGCAFVITVMLRLRLDISIAIGGVIIITATGPPGHCRMR